MACAGAEGAPPPLGELVGSEPTPASPAVVCADPGARADAAFDVVALENEPNAEFRFTGAGLAAGDFDGDGDLDLFVPGPVTARVWENTGDGVTWTEAAGALPDVDFTDAVGAAAADMDGDGDLDLAVTRYLKSDLLLVNVGDGTFTSSPTALPTLASQSPTWFDADVDGDLDLAIAGHGAVDPGAQLDIVRPGDPSVLLLGDGTGTFVDGSTAFDSTVHDGYSYVLGPTHLDDDRVPDLLVANDYPGYIPTLAASYADHRWRADDGSLGLNLVVAGMGLGIADVNDDGRDDFLLPGWDRVFVARSSSFGPWIEVAQVAGFVVPRPPTDLEWIGWGTDWADLDNDGDMDGIIAYGHLDTVVDAKSNGDTVENAELQGIAAYLQDGAGASTFTESGADLGLTDLGVWRGFASADLNGDGWIDLAVRDQGGRVVLYVSRCGAAAWIKVRPEPIASAVGADVVVWVDGHRYARTIRAGGTSLASSNPPEAVVGLGGASRIDDVEIIWPDGAITHTGPVPVRTVVRVSSEGVVDER